MNKEQLAQWYRLYRQLVNGYHLSKQDETELLQLNHLLMEVVNKIHNDNMLRDRK